MRQRDPNGPTAKIIEMARKAPGGLVRWSEAEAAYMRSRPGTYNVTVKNGTNRIMKKYFVKVQGVRGHYVLAETIDSLDPVGDLQILDEFQRKYGVDPDTGMSLDPDALDDYSVTTRWVKMSQILA